MRGKGFGRGRFLGSSVPDLLQLLRLIPRPQWSTPVLIILGILASFAEAMGITLILLFFYSMMNRLDVIASSSGILGEAIRYTTTRFGSPRKTALFILLLIIVRGALAYIYAIVSSFVSEEISQATRDRIHRQYLYISYCFMEQHDQAELMQILGTESWLISGAYGKLTRIMVNIVSIVILGALLLLLSWKIAFCALVGSLLVSIFLRQLSKQARVLGVEFKSIHLKLGEHMLIALEGMRSIRAFGKEETYQKRFEAASAQAREVALKSSRLVSLLDPVTEIGYLIILGVIILSANIIGIDFAITLACVALLYRLQPHVREMEGHLLSISQSAPQLRAVRLMLEVDEKHYIKPGELPLENLSQSIRFNHVSFSYQADNRLALDDVSFEIPCGSTTALVGASGSGKTTIVNLLLRLYEAGSGVISVDGIPLNSIRREEWLRLVAVAGQDVDLVEGNIIDNIKMADLHASEESVKTALEIAGVADLVESLPNGYDTWIGQHGLRFSGGQRQRFGLARAVLHDPEFLILDEAMSALDRQLEQQIRKALEHRYKGRTILLITHRLETILDADHVICLEEGKIVAEGKPRDLLLDANSALSRALLVSSETPVVTTKQD
jgi:ABC-type multidrug transport system fused ATPase/permease subunit